MTTITTSKKSAVLEKRRKADTTNASNTFSELPTFPEFLEIHEFQGFTECPEFPEFHQNFKAYNFLFIFLKIPKSYNL